MTTQRRILAVTGASGYMGTALCAAAINAGWNVLALSRRAPHVAGCKFVAYDLAQPVDATALSGVTAVIHLASDTLHSDPDAEFELGACRTLIDAAQNVGARFVYVSSQAARPDAPTGYGRTKWALEQLVLAAKGVVVRPGLVYGGRGEGLFGRLCSIVRRLPVLPALWPAPLVQLIHIDDVAKALLAAADPLVPRSGVFEIADPEPTTFTTFLRAIARYRIRKFCIFVPVPTALVGGALALAAKFNWASGIGPARFDSLTNLRMMGSTPGNTALGISPRPLADGLHPTGSLRRRDLAREGRTLLIYFTQQAPSRVLIRRYVRAVEQIDGGTALDFSGVVHACPRLLLLIEGPRFGVKSDIQLDRRLDFAFQIAEASVHTQPFLLEKPLAWPLAAMHLMWHGGVEVIARFLRPIVGPALHKRTIRSCSTVDR
jgi:nucleoside-diphosphate-sugar epimerase